MYYPDVVSSELAARVAAGKDVVAAGDFNEAHDWDARHNTLTTYEFSSRLESAGLADQPRRAWSAVVTMQTKHPHQVDSVFASAGASVVVDAVESSSGPHDGLSDHFPITFTVCL